jgi:hypothetical protein
MPALVVEPQELGLLREVLVHIHLVVVGEGTLVGLVEDPKLHDLLACDSRRCMVVLENDERIHRTAVAVEGHIVDCTAAHIVAAVGELHIAVVEAFHIDFREEAAAWNILAGLGMGVVVSKEGSGY